MAYKTIWFYNHFDRSRHQPILNPKNFKKGCWKSRQQVFYMENKNFTTHNHQFNWPFLWSFNEKLIPYLPCLMLRYFHSNFLILIEWYSFLVWKALLYFWILFFLYQLDLLFIYQIQSKIIFVVMAITFWSNLKTFVPQNHSQNYYLNMNFLISHFNCRFILKNWLFLGSTQHSSLINYCF